MLLKKLIMASATVENYLKAFYFLANDRGEVSLSDLSDHLGVSRPTVNSMVKTLQHEDWVNYEKYKPLKLTEKGQKAAALIIRKHRLTEMFLVEKMGFGWEEVHDIAEQVEHVKSTAFFDRMDKLMDFPKVDPHGSPIPDRDGNVKDNNYKQLAECQVGDKVKLVALNNSSKDFLKFLDNRDISLNLEMQIKSIENFDGSIIVSYQGHPSQTLSKIASEKLLVQTV
jgi:DtxR family Mn-dependent transcriptional regulator